ncbi:MAG: hypothetical protein ISS25_00425 [Nanoarchaeota archaeon]|nr:hypothetical protein [DPANN group archaeon]MBL7116282.1 hypothetical protein [Nanoarchaeota archaeon]
MSKKVEVLEEQKKAILEQYNLKLKELRSKISALRKEGKEGLGRKNSRKLLRKKLKKRRKKILCVRRIELPKNQCGRGRVVREEASGSS